MLNKEDDENIMELIKARITFFYNNEVKDKCTTNFQIVENIPNSETIKIHWDNLSEMFNKYWYDLPFTIYNFKKGRVISFFDASIFNKSTWDIKEWKTPELNMSIQIDYLPAEYVSINEILKYYDSEMAIRYLIERGLSVIEQ